MQLLSSQFSSAGCSQSRGRNGFSLIELLVVMLIISVLLALAIPATNSLSRGWKMKESQGKILGLMQLGRQYASTQSAHFFLAFHEDTAEEKLSAILIRSDDGTDPFTEFGVNTIDMDNQPTGMSVHLAQKKETIPHVVLRPAGYAAYSRTIDRPAGATDIENTNRELIYQGETYEHIIQFTPAGTIRIDNQEPVLVEFGIEQSINQNLTQELTVFQIPGTTGQPFVYSQ